MTKVSKLTTEGKLSYGIKIESSNEDFIIPVVDVRDGEKAREKANSMQKAANITGGSKFFQPSFSIWGYSYNHSMKK